MQRTAAFILGTALMIAVVSIVAITMTAEDSRDPDPPGALKRSEIEDVGGRSLPPPSKSKQANRAVNTHVPKSQQRPAPRLEGRKPTPGSPSDPADGEDDLCVVQGCVQSTPGTGVQATVESLEIHSAADCRTKTDESGVFTLRLPPGEFRLTAYPEKGRTAQCFLSIEKSKTSKFVTIRVPRGFDLGGVVSDAVTGLPIADARLTARHRVATTDRTGKYTLGDIDPTVRLTVQAGGYNPKRANLKLRSDTVRNFKLRRAVDVTGTVLNSAGHPISGARISSGSVQVDSDETGRFRLEGVAFNEKSMTARVSAEAEGYAGKARGVFQVDAPSHLELVLFRGATVTGRVVDAGGNGVSGVRASAQPYRGIGIVVATDGSGAFTISGIRRGRCTVRVHGDSLIATPGWREVRLDEGQLAAVAPFVVSRGVVARGIIVDQAGNPAPGVDVIATFTGAPRKTRRKLGGNRYAKTNEHGRFMLRGLMPGPYTVDLISPNGDYFTDYHTAKRMRSPRKLLATEGMAEVTFRMEKCHAGIVGTVKEAESGQAVDDFVVHLERHGADCRAYSVKMQNANGEVRIGKIREGRYRVWVVADGRRTSGVKTIELLYGKAAATVNFLISRE